MLLGGNTAKAKFTGDGIVPPAVSAWTETLYMPTCFPSTTNLPFTKRMFKFSSLCSVVEVTPEGTSNTNVSVVSLLATCINGIQFKDAT